MKEAREIVKQWNKQKTNKERLQFLKENQGNLVLVLDNDSSWVRIKRDHMLIDSKGWEEWMDELDTAMESFDGYYGNTDEIIELFQFIGIEAEEC